MGQVKNNSLARQQYPLATGNRTLFYLHAAMHFSLIITLCVVTYLFSLWPQRIGRHLKRL